MKQNSQLLNRSKFVLLTILLLGLVACNTPDPDPTAAPVDPASPTPQPTDTLTPAPTLDGETAVNPDGNAAIESLPLLRYLGEGSNTYTINSGQFLVKRRSPFRFETEPAPTYTARASERVWQLNGNIPIRLYEQTHSFGAVHPGCTIFFVQIDDDVDGRRNYFLLDNNVILEVPQGIDAVTGSLQIERSGTLTFEANDSVGAYIDVGCPPTPLPTNTPTPTNTTRPTNTPTPTMTGTPTNTPDQPITVTPTFTPGTITPTVDPPEDVTPSATAPPSTVTPTPSPTVPVGPAFTRFNFEMAGQTARDGFCYMHRDTGELLLVWQMQDGWTDSAAHPDADADGWLEVKIPHVSIYVEVFCDTGNGRMRMNIHNGIVHPETGEIVGWLTRGVHHAIEIGWPE